LNTSSPLSTLLNPWPKLIADPINTPILTKFCGGYNNSFHSYGCCHRMKLLSNLYSNMLSPDFSSCHFWHSWCSWGDSSLTILHYLVTHWYILWCRMKMWIQLQYFALGLNGWINLSTMWSQLAF
jgi:hypothetical protein